MRDFVEWYEQDVGQGVVRDAVARLPADRLAVFQLDRDDLGILPSRWYPVDGIHRILDALTEGRSVQDQRDMAEACAQAMVAKMQTGVHRVVFQWFLTPGRYAKIVDWAWRLNYNDGRVVTTVLGPNRHQGIVEEWGGHHPLLCMVNVSVKRAIYTAMGCADARIESSYCVDRGDDECGSIIAWSDRDP